jgi:hypothetical protein
MRWKYHQGIPFWVLTTTVSGPSSGPSCGRERREGVRLHAEHDDVGGPIAVRSPARGGALRIAIGLTTRSPAPASRAECGRARTARRPLRLRAAGADVAADRPAPTMTILTTRLG